MTSRSRLPVIVVAGLHRAQRRRAVQELQDTALNAIVLHHDLRNVSARIVHRELRTSRGTHDTADLPLYNNCACCTLREDLLPELLRIAHSGRHDLAIVELWGGSKPREAVEVLTGGVVAGRPMHAAIELAGVITAVDPDRLTDELSVPDDLVDHGQHTSPIDSRTRAEALAHQIEYATTIAVTRGGSAGLSMLHQLHPTARRAVIDAGELLPAALRGFDAAAARKRVDPATAPLPRAHHEAGVTTVVWERRRPLHPTRLYAALDHLVPAAQRSRGRFWLANRPQSMLAWDAAGTHLAVEECGRWFTTLPDLAGQAPSPAGGATAARGRHAQYGDRIQHLAFTAAGLNTHAVIDTLDACLLTDIELATGQENWKTLPDAFEDLLEPVT